MRRAAAAAIGLAAATLAAAAPPPGLDFDRVFATAGEPRDLHAEIAYRAGGAVHRLALWRDGDSRIVRVTDAALTSVATHRPGEAGFRLSILDAHRRIRTDIDRDSLYKIGSFTDWYDLGHGLRHPKGRYTLTALASAPAGALAPIAPCRWYALRQGDATTAICWSTRDRLPLLIAANGQTIWRVLSVARDPIPASRFAIHDEGYVRTDATSDIDRD